MLSRKSFFLVGLVGVLGLSALGATAAPFAPPSAFPPTPDQGPEVEPVNPRTATPMEGIAFFEIQAKALKESEGVRVVGRWYGKLDMPVRVWKEHEDTARAFGLVPDDTAASTVGSDSSLWRLPLDRQARTVKLVFNPDKIAPYDGLFALEQVEKLPAWVHNLKPGDAVGIACS